MELDASQGEVLRDDRPNLYLGIAPETEVGQRIAMLLDGAGEPAEIRGHVVGDRRDLSAHLSPMPKRQAQRARRRLACQLIRRSHAVHGWRRWRVYVVELDPAEKYPGSDRPWVYVGVTSKTPSERFAQHKRGARNRRGRLYNEAVRRYGVALMPKYHEHIPPCCSKEDGEQAEKELAMRLYRDKGFRVEGDGLPREVRGT